VAAQRSLPSQAWLQAVLTAAQPQLAAAPAAAACDLLDLLSRVDVTPSAAWMEVLLERLCGAAGQLSTRQLAGVAWSLSNLRHTPSQTQWHTLLSAAAAQLQQSFTARTWRCLCAAPAASPAAPTAALIPRAACARQQW
jgi:hypothetical protein